MATVTAANWRAHAVRPAMRMEVGGFHPSGDALASCIGDVRVARPGEGWPRSKGRPMTPLCQLNVGMLAARPATLDDLAVVCVFVGETWFDRNEPVVDAAAPGEGASWCVRAYAEVDGLMPLARPDATASWLRPFEVRWHGPEPDYPPHDMTHELPFDFDALGLGDLDEQEGAENVDASKVGGWPTTVQGEPWWSLWLPAVPGPSMRLAVDACMPPGAHRDEFDFAFQFVGEPKAHLDLGDLGVLSFARSQRDPKLWGVDHQCA